MRVRRVRRRFIGRGRIRTGVRRKAVVSRRNTAKTGSRRLVDLITGLIRSYVTGNQFTDQIRQDNGGSSGFVVLRMDSGTNWTTPTPTNYMDLNAALFNQTQINPLLALFRYAWFNWVKMSFYFTVDQYLIATTGANTDVIGLNQAVAGTIVEVCDNYPLDAFFSASSGVIGSVNDALPWRQLKPDTSGAYHYDLQWRNPFRGADRMTDTTQVAATALFPYGVGKYKGHWSTMAADATTATNPERGLAVLMGLKPSHLLRLPAFRIRTEGNIVGTDAQGTYRTTVNLRMNSRSSMSMSSFAL